MDEITWIDLNEIIVIGELKHRLYQCQMQNCGYIRPERSNHTGPIYAPCARCSWRGGFDRNGKLYNAYEKSRPSKYVGECND